MRTRTLRAPQPASLQVKSKAQSLDTRSLKIRGSPEIAEITKGLQTKLPTLPEHLDINYRWHHDDYMRTTLTVDDDLAERIAELARETRQPFKTVLNQALRRGLGDAGPKEPEFQLRPHAGHLLPGIDDRRLNELAWDPEI